MDMRTLPIVRVLLLALLLPRPSTAVSPLRFPVSTPTAEEIRGLFEQVCSPNKDVSERALTRLEALGEEALPWMERVPPESTLLRQRLGVVEANIRNRLKAATE